MRIVFFGDSLTEGVVGASYLAVLRTLVARQPELRGAELVNAGVGGDTVLNLARRIPTDVVPLAPDAVVVLVGSNDATTLLTRRSLTLSSFRTRRYFRGEKRIRGAVTPGRFADGLRVVVDELAVRTRARIALCTPPLLGERMDTRTWRVLDEYVRAVRSVAQDRTCDLIDVHADFARALSQPVPPRVPSPLGELRARLLPLTDYEAMARLRGTRYVFDDVHFTAAGAEVVAAAMLRWLVATGRRLETADTTRQAHI